MPRATTQYKVGPVAGDIRARYIDEMEQPRIHLYPGETFTGVGSVVYWDVGATLGVHRELDVPLRS